MGKLIALATKAPPAAIEKGYTEMALAALDDAREMVMRADKDGKPATHLIVCMAAAYKQGGEDRLVTSWVTSEKCDDLTAVGVMHLIKQDMFG